MAEATKPALQALKFPCTVFRTQRRMNDYAADDMRCGDLSETQLKTNFKLGDVSTKANPYTLTKIAPFNQRNGMDEKIEKVTRQECAKILFEEFRTLSPSFSLYGPYKHLIGKMINHMQNGNGSPFRDMSLDAALKEQILSDSTKNSSLQLIKDTLNENIDWKNKLYPVEKENRLKIGISRGKLPKFDRLQDNFNGLGITVHDTYATHITIKSLQIDKQRYRAIVHYNIQDHFGLDDKDIIKFRNYRFFRLWFVLQRYNQFGYKPFMTNMEVTIEIDGGRNDN
ncbi:MULTISPECIES: YPO3983 family protein [Yersinia pseudotuberculosis complex]|uniref:DUF3289 family protein n=2 Tax=Yersinia pseudotuberculosis complex TaxID=1649845 RepID=A0A0U1R340_YERP3|nr:MULTISPECIES: YPO3983 family protein [Yersinia pseudotuberculosis complex]ABS49732.1 conserved hypothetical protein [Yersinia pseudotuberculosis IP 31758]AXY33874.1 DUF3289 family protein [Yersinia pseudotuberculosis]AYX09543.1 DUF3289 family protein [Yersinia pseudotuberculosis]MBO1550872.1 DUF3289 family protein [Yersinia pseudotuberculosis]MBO1566934.1 DUF3289 family protein [Yersinia pseudotuberculosis]